MRIIRFGNPDQMDTVISDKYPDITKGEIHKPVEDLDAQ